MEEDKIKTTQETLVIADNAGDSESVESNDVQSELPEPKETEDAESQKEELGLVMESFEEKSIRFTHKARITEETEGSYKYKVAKGEVAFIEVGMVTKNGTSYSQECGRNIKRDYQDILAGCTYPMKMYESGIVGRMKATHNSSYGRGNELMDTVAYITEFYHTRNGSRMSAEEQVLNGDIIGVTFRTADSVFGEHIAELLINGAVEGVSLNAIWEKRHEEYIDGLDVYVYDKLSLEGFAVDFTGFERQASMNFSNQRDKNFLLAMESIIEEKLQMAEKENKKDEIVLEEQEVEKEETKEPENNIQESEVAEEASDEKQEVAEENVEEKPVVSEEDYNKKAEEAEKYRLEAINGRLDNQIAEALSEPNITKFDFVKESFGEMLNTYKKVAAKAEDPEKAMESYIGKQSEKFMGIVNKYEKKNEEKEMEQVNLNLAGKDAREAGLRKERYGKAEATREEELISAILGEPIVNSNGANILDVTGVNSLLRNKGKSTESLWDRFANRPFKTGNLHTSPRSVFESYGRTVEADEVDIAGYSTLYPAIMSALMKVSLMAPVLSMGAKAVPAMNKTHVQREHIIRKSEMHEFGTFTAASGTFGGTDDGALTAGIGRHLFVEVTTAPSVENILIATGTDQAGATLYGFCVVPAGAKAESRWYFAPVATAASTGAYKGGYTFNDVSGIATEGGSVGTGVYTVGVEASPAVTITSGSDLKTTGQYANYTWAEHTISVKDYMIFSQLSWDVIADFNREFANHNMGGIAEWAQEVIGMLANERDRDGFETINATGFSYANLNVDISSPGTYAEQLAKAQINLVDAMNYLKTFIKDLGKSHGRTQNLVAYINPTDMDIFHLVNKYGNTFHKHDTIANPYERRAYVGNWNGVDFYESYHQTKNKISFLDKRYAYDVIYVAPTLKEVTDHGGVKTVDEFAAWTQAIHWFPNSEYVTGKLNLTR